MLLETAGKWQAFSSQQGRAKVCYALSKAESRLPANLKDVEGLLFVSSRPGEGVRNEISFVMNFDLKEGVEHQAIIGNERFALAAKGECPGMNSIDGRAAGGLYADLVAVAGRCFAFEGLADKEHAAVGGLVGHDVWAVEGADGPQ